MKQNYIIDRLKRMGIFARVVESGSMSAAARELGMTTSAVSQQLRQLEAETGLALLHRSTRRLSTTEIGQAYYEDCAAMLHAAQSAEQRLSDLREEPRGELRIAFPVGFSAHLAAQTAERSAIRAIQDHVLAHLKDDLSVPALASRAGMSERNFARVFKQEAGSTPAEFVELARIDAARRLAEESDLPLKRLADEVGYANVDGFRRAFLRRLGVTPSDYRARFRLDG